jgi:undecaprenyl-diphosphatase
MTNLQAFLMGLIQGLAEFLPISSSGHLELGNYFFNIQSTNNLSFSITVHAATVLSTITVFRKDILHLVTRGLTIKRNPESRYISLLLFSAVPIAIVGLSFLNKIESLFNENLLLVGCCLIMTALLLLFAHFIKGTQSRKINFRESFIIGLAQTIAILPGISRSGFTIATGILLGIDRKEVARFSFLMVLVPIIGGVFLDLMRRNSFDVTNIGNAPLMIGFLTAFITGLLACKFMIKIVSRGNLIYFSIYCLITGLIAIFAG